MNVSTLCRFDGSIGGCDNDGGKASLYLSLQQ